MSAKVAVQIAGSFIIALLQIVTVAPQEIPDGKVYTELKKTLIHGSSGILTCRFTGPPYAVFWKKGYDPWTSPTLVTWTPEAKTGPRYEDGSCDMTENYSLVIKTVNDTDTGHYICLVSNQHGILIDNYTDVTVTDVGLDTEPEISLEKGFAGILPCKLNVRPKVVTWKKGPTYSLAKILVAVDKYHNVGKISGPGYEEGLFNITADYSLVIAHVNIEDEGQYFCELLEVDTDTTFQDFANVNVFARPIKPFPAIEGCSTTADHSNCIFTADSSAILKCHANEYYPDVGLYFKHGSKEVEALHTKTWNNTDGTKNKSVAIVGHISHELYTCIAFGIPGEDGNRSTSVLLVRRNGSLNLVAIIVPIVLIVIVIAVGLPIRIFLRRRGTDSCILKGDRPTYPEDPVAYLELWKLVEYASIHKELDILGDAIGVQRYDGNESTGATTKEQNMYYYNGLCSWKETCKGRMQRTTLHKTLYEKSLEKPSANLKDFRGTVSTETCEFDLEHILWEIGEPDEITKFLVSLNIDPPERPGESETSFEFHQQALDKLIIWTKGNRDINPSITLSSTLETLNHESANKFFLISDEKKRGLADSAYKEIARNFSRNHVAMLAPNIKSSSNTVIMVSKTLEENSETLFNIEQMLRDWWKEQECSNYKRRCKLDAALGDVQQRPPEDSTHTDEQWPSDEELKLIAHYIDQKSATRVSEHLGMSDLPESADEQQRFEALCAWRQSNQGEWTELHGELVSALKDTNIPGLLLPLRNDAVHKFEVVDIAFNLLMTDILPVARRLGVCQAKLSSYRPVFEPSHITKGTIGLVSTLVSSLGKNNQREDLWRKLREAGFPSTIQRKMIVYAMSYGELSAISNAVMRSGTRSEENINTAEEGGQPNEGDSLLVREEMLSPDTTTVPMEPEVGEAQDSSQHFNTIKKMLNLTDEEVAAGSSMTDPLDEFTLFKIWKEKPRLSAFNERAAVIKCLHDFGKTDIARSFIEGKYKADERKIPSLSTWSRR